MHLFSPANTMLRLWQYRHKLSDAETRLLLQHMTLRNGRKWALEFNAELVMLSRFRWNDLPVELQRLILEEVVYAFPAGQQYGGVCWKWADWIRPIFFRRLTVNSKPHFCTLKQWIEDEEAGLTAMPRMTLINTVVVDWGSIHSLSYSTSDPKTGWQQGWCSSSPVRPQPFPCSASIHAVFSYHAFSLRW